MVVKSQKKTPIVILVLFFLRTCHGQTTTIILLLRPTGLLAYSDVLLDIHTPLRPRKSYIFIQLDHVCYIAPLYGGPIKFSILHFWKEFNVELLNLSSTTTLQITNLV